MQAAPKRVFAFIGTIVLLLTVETHLAWSDATAYQNDPAHDGAATFAVFNPTPTPLWSTNLGSNVGYAVIAGNDVYTNTNSTLKAFAALNGTPVWSVSDPTQGTSPLGYAPTYDNGDLFVVTGNSNQVFSMTGYNAVSGTELWGTTLPGQTSFRASPTASGGYVYANGTGSGGTAYAVNESTGALKWTAASGFGSTSSPAVVSGGVYVAYGSPQVYKYDSLTGNLDWHYASPSGGGGNPGSTPVYSNGEVFVTGIGTTGWNGNNVLAIGSSTGQSSFTAVNGVAQSFSPPAFYNGTGYISYIDGGGNNLVTAFNASTGALDWTKQFNDGGESLSAPLVINGFVYVDSYIGNLYVLNGSTGATLDTIQLAGGDQENTFADGQMTAANGLLAVPNGPYLEVFELPEPTSATMAVTFSTMFLLRRARKFKGDRSPIPVEFSRHM